MGESQDTIDEILHLMEKCFLKEKMNLHEDKRVYEALLAEYMRKTPEKPPEEAALASSHVENAHMITIPSSQNLHFKDDEPVGLPVGGYEEKRKKLASERKADYNKFLLKKEKEKYLKRKGEKSPRATLLSYEEFLQNSLGSNHFGAYGDSLHDVRSTGSVGETEKTQLDNHHEKEKYLKRKEEQSPGSTLLSYEEFLQNSLSSNRFGAYGDSLHNVRSTGSVGKTEKTQLDIHNFSSENSVKNTPSTSVFNQNAKEPGVDSSSRRSIFSSSAPGGREFYNYPQRNESSIEQTVYGFTSRPKKCVYNKEQHKKDLELQMKEKEVQKMMEKEKEWAKSDILYPWSHRIGGGGDPIRDTAGNVITSRKVQSPAYMPYYGREDVLRKNAQHKQDLYRAELYKQIEENRRLKELEKKKEQEEEEITALRLDEQRRKMRKEYEEERAKNLRKEEEARLKMERLMQLQIARAKEEEQRRKDEAERRKRDREKWKQAQDQIPVTSVNVPPSPPIPAIRTQVLEKVLQKPPSPKTSINLPADTSQSIVSQLSEIRKMMLDQQNRMDNLMQNEKKTYKILNRRTIQEDSDDDDDIFLSDIGSNNRSEKW